MQGAKMAFNNKKYPSKDFDKDRPLRFEQRFLMLRKLGQGTYGKVQLALNKETNEEVAVKTIKKAKIENEEDMLRIRREIHIMSSLQHPHIVHIHEVFETTQKIVIVMQYASGGELYDYLGCHQTLPEDEARRIFRQIASAIYYCHKNQICHRDLKLENILLDEEGNSKIADFGLSNIFDDKRRMNTFCGSPLYASPEIVKGTPYKGPEVDCWSLGVLLYTLVYGTMPFDGRSFKELVSQISEGRYEEPVYKSNASSLIRRLLTPDVHQRATIEDVCKDSWLNEGYDTLLINVAENMALSAELHKQNIRAKNGCSEKISKNPSEIPIFKKEPTQLQEKAQNCTSVLTKNFENILKTNEINSQKGNPNFYEKILNYDVRFILNKIVANVEASLKIEKLSNNLNFSNMTTIGDAQKREENAARKVDSAYIIPIFEVKSMIPEERGKNLGYIGKNTENNSRVSMFSSRPGSIKLTKENVSREESVKNIFAENSINPKTISQNRDVAVNLPEKRYKEPLPTNAALLSTTLLKNSQKSLYTLSNSVLPQQRHSSKKYFQTSNQQGNQPPRHPLQKNEPENDNFSCGKKQPNPFMRTKNHVLQLARLLSLNYEKIARNSFKISASKKKLPGKITIPPTFDPNNPTSDKKIHEDKKELLIFPTISVSENKEKIQKKIEKIKRAALNKNLIIRSNSTARIKIEKYIRSQVKRIQDLVREEQRSLQASLEHLDEQSLRDMSEMYYCTYGSENTDSGIANAEDEEYFCFVCSKPNMENGSSGVLDSFLLESIKKGCLYTSNHLHIPRAKEHDKWGYSLNSMNLEFGSLNRCKSEIHFPHEYLNYISPNNRSDLSKKMSPKQAIQRNITDNARCFLTVPSTTTPNIPDMAAILRSASDSAVFQLSNNTFDVIKLNTECHENEAENYNFLPHYLQQIPSARNAYFETTNNETQSNIATDTFMSHSRLDKDDGIGDSNDSFQSYMETLENSENDSKLTRSMSSQSYTNFTKDNSTTKQPSRKFLKELQLRNEYKSKGDDLESEITDQTTSIKNILNSESWLERLSNERVLSQQSAKDKGLKRHNTMSCLRRKSEIDDELNFENSCTEFESYLWNAYKDHLLENNRHDTEYSSSPNLNYYSHGRKNKFKNRDSKSMDYINGDASNDFMSKEFSKFSYPNEESDEISSTFKKVLKCSNTTRNRPDKSGSRLNRTKSMCAESFTDSDRDDIIQRIKHERKLSHCSTSLGTNAQMSDFFNDLEMTDHRSRKNIGSNRRRFSTTNLPKNKQNKSEYKKSFLQLLALKRVEEAEKELNNKSPPSPSLLNNEENNSGSLLEALKTHGYKNVISQRLQATDDDDDFLDSFHMKYLKSPRQLRAELARLNSMYYDTLPSYTLGPLEGNNYFYDDLDYYTTSLLSGIPTTSYCDMPYDFRQQPKQSVYEWLDTTLTDEYIDSLRSGTSYANEELTPIPETKRNYTNWVKRNYKFFNNEGSSEYQDTIDNLPPNNAFSASSKNKQINASNEVNPMNSERFESNRCDSDDKEQESVLDRIWRKSFYSRFNNRALSRKERLSFVGPELSESRLGFLHNRYGSPIKSEYDESEPLQRCRSKKSFHTKRGQKHSQSFDKFESRNSLKKKSAKTVPEKDTALENEQSCSKKTFKNSYSSCENEEPEH